MGTVPEDLSRGTPLVLQPRGTSRTVTIPVFSSGDHYLHFLVDPDAEILEAVRRENRVTVSDENGDPVLKGTVQILDVGPSQYERTTARTDLESPAPEKRLLRFRATHRRVGEDWQTTPLKGPGPLRAWLRAFRVELLSASLIPVLLGFAYALWRGWPFDGSLALLSVGAAVCMHLGANLHNDVSDHWRGVDLYGREGGSGIIQRGWLSPRQVFRAAVLFFLSGTLLGLPLVLHRGTDLLVVSALGLIGALGYSQRHFGYKYTGLGDLCVFLLLGPLMVVGASIAVSGRWDGGLVMVGIPIGFFVALILHGNNLHDLHVDRRAGVTTLAMLLGFQGSKLYYEVVLLAGYGMVGVMVFLALVPSWSLLTFITLPVAWRNLRRVRAARNPSNPILRRLRFGTARLHLLVGMLYVASFLAETWL